MDIIKQPPANGKQLRTFTHAPKTEPTPGEIAVLLRTVKASPAAVYVWRDGEGPWHLAFEDVNTAPVALEGIK